MFRVSPDWLNLTLEISTFYEHFLISAPSMCPADHYFYTCSAVNIHISVSQAVVAAVAPGSSLPPPPPPLPPPPPPISPTASPSLAVSLSLFQPNQWRQMAAHRWVWFHSKVFSPPPTSACSWGTCWVELIDWHLYLKDLVVIAYSDLVSIPLITLPELEYAEDHIELFFRLLLCLNLTGTRDKTENSTLLFRMFLS